MFFVVRRLIDLNQTDAKAAQERLMEVLEEITDKTCHLLLEVPGDILPEAAAAASVVWDAIYAVRRSYRSMTAPGLGGGPQRDSMGFSAQVEERLCPFIYTLFSFQP